MTCPLHRSYTGIKRPVRLCFTCNRIWELKNAQEEQDLFQLDNYLATRRVVINAHADNSLTFTQYDNP